MFVYTIPRLCIAFTTSVVLLGQAPAQAAALIRCPDWQRYVTPTAALRSTAAVGPAGHSMRRWTGRAKLAREVERPKQSFEAALKANRARESRLASAKGQKVPTGTLASPRTARNESGAARTTGPLDAAGIFSRKGRKTKKQAIPCPTHTVRKGDTLSKIAKARLGSAKRYPELIAANKDTVKSATTLRVGTVLTLPCAVPTRQTASLQRKTRSGAAKTAPAPKPVAVKPMNRPLPVWTARPGEFVSDVITRWARKAGHTVVRDGVEEWKLSVPVKISGSFKDALDQLVVGFEGAGRPLAISVYANKVIRIGRPL